MNKADLISAVAAESGLSKADAKKAVEGVVSAVSNALKSGDKVSLVGFGTFSVVEKAEWVSTRRPKNLSPLKQKKQSNSRLVLNYRKKSNKLLILIKCKGLKRGAPAIAPFFFKQLIIYEYYENNLIEIPHWHSCLCILSTNHQCRRDQASLLERYPNRSSKQRSSPHGFHVIR